MKSVVKIRIYQTVLSRPGVNQINFADPLVISGITGNTGGQVTWVGTTGFTANPGTGEVVFGGAPQGVLSQQFPNELDQEKFYNVGFQITGVTSGSVDVYMGSERIGNYDADGTYEVLWFRTGTTSVGSISFAPVKESGNDFIGTIRTSSVYVRENRGMGKLTPRVESYIPMGYLDTKEDTTLAFNWQLSDAANINKSQGSFFKSFQLPGSKNNRDVLGLTGEDNLTFDSVDIRNKFRADIVVDDNDFVSGWLVIKSVTRDQNEVDYECDFYDSVFGLFDQIQNKKVSDIDCSSFDHIVTAENIFKTWEPDRPWTSCFTYPLFHLDGTNGLYTTKDFSPSFYNKFLFNQIILSTNAYGYSISPEADSTFSRMITTPSGRRRTIDVATDGEGVYVGMLSDQSITIPPYVDESGVLLRLANKRIEFTDDYVGDHFDPYGAWDTGQLQYNLQQAGTPHVFEFHVETTIISTPSFTGFDSSEQRFLYTGNPYFGASNYDPTESIVEVYIDNPNGVRMYPQSLQYEFPRGDLDASSATTSVQVTFSGTVTLDDPIPGNYVIRLRVVDNLIWFVGNLSYAPLDNSFFYNREVIIDSSTSWLKANPVLGSEVGDNAVQRLNKWLPQVGQAEFINEQMNFFNMFAFEDINKTIKFITSTELYADTHVMDWSGKVQWVDSMQPLTDISSSRTILGWKDTDDVWNNAYRDDVGVQYGDFLFDNETNLFNEEEENRSRIYGATPMVTDGGGRVVSAIHTRDLPKEHRCILQGDNYYPAGEKISMQYYNPFQTDLWGFEDNYYYEADLGQGYVNNLGFVSSTPSNWEVGDWIVVTQNDDWQYSNDDTYDANYNGLAQILSLVEPTPGQYVVVVNKPKPSSTIVIPGRAYRLSSRSVYRSDVHINSLSASTVDINWGTLDHTLLSFPIEMTPNCLGNKYYRNRLIQLRDGYMYTVYARLSLLDVKELLDHVGGKIWVDSLNSYFTLYSIQDFDVVDHKLTKVELLKVVGTDDFATDVTADGNQTTGGFTTDGNLGSIFQPTPAGTSGTVNFTTQYGNVIRGGATFIAGTGNQTFNETRNLFVAGNNNSFDYGVHNTFVLGNNQNITESNALYLSNYALFTQNRTELYGATTFTNCGMTIDNVYIGSSGVTVGGLSGVSISSTGITINGVSLTDHTHVQDGVNTYTGGTAAKPTVNVVASPLFTSVSATTFYSGTTNIDGLFAPASVVATYVQPGLNITTGGTISRPVVATVQNPAFSAITVGSGVTITSTGITIQGLLITSGFTGGGTLSGNYLPISGGTLTGNTVINSGHTLQFKTTNGTGSVTLSSPSTTSGNWIVDLPNDDGELALVPKSKVVTSDTTVTTATQYYMCNTFAGGFYAFLPSSPSLGEQYHFFDQRGSFSSGPLTISGGTNRVGPDTYLILSADHRSCFVTWNGIGWSPIVTS